MRLIADQRGYNMIEILLVVAILGFLLMGIFGFLILGNTTFQRGARQTYLQHSLRHASNYITNEVRFAIELQVMDIDEYLPLDPGEVESGYNYIYYGGEDDRRIYHLDSNRIYPITDEVVTMLDFSTDGKRFYFIIEAADGAEQYTIDTMVLLLNSHPVLKEPPVELIPAVRYRIMPGIDQ